MTPSLTYIRALSLIETVVTVAIVAVIVPAIVGSIIFFYRANTSSLEQSYQVNNARRGVEFLVRDVREATYGDTGAYPLAGIASTSLTFYADTDNDASIERISYTLIDTALYRTVLKSSGVPPSYSDAGATSTVSLYVRNLEEVAPLFRYYDKSGNEITDYAEVDEVRSVAVFLVVNVLPVRAPTEFTLRSRATLRNLRN